MTPVMISSRPQLQMLRIRCCKPPAVKIVNRNLIEKYHGGPLDGIKFPPCSRGTNSFTSKRPALSGSFSLAAMAPDKHQTKLGPWS